MTEEERFIKALELIKAVLDEIKENNGGWLYKENAIILKRYNDMLWNIDGIEEVKTRILVDDCEYYQTKLKKNKEKQLSYLDLLN